MEQQINILFVDDQWCRPEDRSTIVAAFGPLTRREVPYRFHYETGEDGSGSYAVEPVLRTINGIPNLRAVILDIMFGSEQSRLGLKILTAIREKYPILPVIMMTSIDNEIDVVEQCMELGANEYLIKKPTLEELETALRIYTQPSALEADYAIWGNSTVIRQVRSTIARVAVSGSASVLVTGESGTGKELVARAIHRQGPRRRAPFIDKNCAHEKSDLLDSDLFGHEKGAFTSADRQHIGRIERANGGVLFLDEIGSMSSELQAKLLRVLETRCFQRLGGTQDVSSDFQLICATNENCENMLKSGRLREDLFYRIRQIEIHIPPLKERKSDLPILTELFLNRFRSGTGASYRAEHFSQEAIKKMLSYSWPGNVRELRNVTDRAVILCRNHTIGSKDLPSEILNSNTGGNKLASRASQNVLPEDQALWARHLIISQLKIIAEALDRSGGNATLAVKSLFPMINSPNSTYIKRFIKRLQESPWGYSKPNDAEINSLVEQIARFSQRENKC